MSKQIPQKSRLGRGLSSLMNSTVEEVQAAPATATADAPVDRPSTERPDLEMVQAPLDAIVANPHQPRRVFEEGALKELAASLKTSGMIQPVVARDIGDGKYELIAGERRWRAARIAGLETLPVILRRVDPVMQAQMALVENLQRTDLNAIERAGAYKALLDNLGLTQGELADRLGEDRTVISHFLRLLDLIPDVQRMIADERLSFSHAKLLAGVADQGEQKRLAELAVDQGLNVRNLERLINLATPTQPAESRLTPAASAHLLDLERNLSRNLGMRVQVKVSAGKKKGRVILHYQSLDQFDQLVEKLGISIE